MNKNEIQVIKSMEEVCKNTEVLATLKDNAEDLVINEVNKIFDKVKIEIAEFSKLIEMIGGKNTIFQLIKKNKNICRNEKGFYYI